jgi:hypothetical protein
MGDPHGRPFLAKSFIIYHMGGLTLKNYAQEHNIYGVGLGGLVGVIWKMLGHNADPGKQPGFVFYFYMFCFHNNLYQ